MVQVLADQRQAVPHWRRQAGLVQRKSLAHKVKYVSAIAFIDPQHALSAKDAVRELLEKALKLVGRKRLVGLE